MKKSAYMLLTIVAALAALFFLGYWMGYGITLNRANVERRIHEAWCRTDDRRAHDPSCRLDSVFVWELIDKNFRRLKFHLDTGALADSTVRLRADLRYHADYARELEEGRTFVIPLGDGERGVRAHIVNLRAESVGGQLYYSIGSLVFICLVLWGVLKQRDIIRGQDKLARMREDFSYAMIHDMKTPLSTIIMGLKVLRSGRLDALEEKKQRNFDILEGEAAHLLALTNKVLTLSKLEHEQLLLYPEFIALRPMVDDLVQTFTAKAQKPVTFRTDLREEAVFADGEFLKEALANLLDNALKYSKDSVEVRIASWAEEGYTRISVRDNGIGIPLAAQATIFDNHHLRQVRARPACRRRQGAEDSRLRPGAELRDERGARAWRLRHGGERRGQVQRVHPVAAPARRKPGGRRTGGVKDSSPKVGNLAKLPYL